MESKLSAYAIILQVTPVVAIAHFLLVLSAARQARVLACAWIIALFPVLANARAWARASVDHAWSTCSRSMAPRAPQRALAPWSLPSHASLRAWRPSRSPAASR